MSLSRQEIDQFERDGFLGPFRVLPSDIAMQVGERIRREVLTTRCEVYAHTKGDFEKVDYTRDRHLDSPLLYRIASAPEIVSRVASLLGPDFLCWRSDVFLQRAGDLPTYAHQDIDLSGTRVIPSIAAPDAASAVGTIHHPSGPSHIPRCISAWISFDRITVENGGLWFVPGTHKAVIPEVPGDGFAGRKLVLSRTFERSLHHDVEVEPGELMLFHNLLVHGSYEAKQGQRLAWTTRYVTPETRVYPNGPINAQGQDLSRFGSVLVHGHDRVHRNVLRAPPLLAMGSILDEPSVG